ncbi:MAG: hypothetical protein DRP68_06155 [Candidatus Omnitrophota bacterium]|nr:MAG: hypothetical protein DRP68_06155 [Candidatus Omnitrophota bacterium]
MLGKPNKRGRRMKICKVLAVAILFSLSLTQAESQEKAFNLGEVIVTATKTEHTLADVPAEAVVITKEEIKAKNIKTVQDALTYLTGIKINKNCGSWGDKGKIEMLGLDA